MNYHLKDIYKKDDKMVTDVDIDVTGTSEERFELYIDADMITRSINNERDRRRGISQKEKISTVDYNFALYDKPLIQI